MGQITLEQPIWKPHPGPQEEALRRSEFEVLFGGSRGPGKTDAGLVLLTDYIDHPLYRALVLRKTAEDLSDWLDRAGRMYASLGGEVKGQPARIEFPSGAIIRTGHLKDRKSYEKYLGHEYQIILIEELTQVPEEKYYIQIIGSCRSTVDGLVPRVFCTTNPGGVGHGWVKRRFVDPAPWGTPFLAKDTGRWRIFIHATVDDNPTLLEKDPGYIQYLDALKLSDEDLWKAWRYGDWDVFAGQVFREWMHKDHVQPKFGWSLDACSKIISFDWGYNAPGCAMWIAQAPENAQGVVHRHVYRELYLNRQTPKDWAKLIRTITAVEPVDYMVLPHDCFSSDKGEQTIAEIIQEVGQVTVIRGNTLGKGARLNRKAITHQNLAIAEDARPVMTVHPNCKNLIRTLPELVYSEISPEDVDTDGEDHAYDALSLGLMTLSEVQGSSSSISNANSDEVEEGITANEQGAYEGLPSLRDLIGDRPRVSRPDHVFRR